MFMQKILDFIYIVFFGKYTLDGFVSEKKKLLRSILMFSTLFFQTKK